jgi:hypothetical protein
LRLQVSLPSAIGVVEERDPLAARPFDARVARRCRATVLDEADEEDGRLRAPLAKLLGDV